MAQNISKDLFSVNFPVKLWTTRILTAVQKGSTQWDQDEERFNISTLNAKFLNDLHIDLVPLPTDSFGPVSGRVYL